MSSHQQKRKDCLRHFCVTRGSCSKSLGDRIATDSLQQKVQNETYTIDAFYDKNVQFFIYHGQ